MQRQKLGVIGWLCYYNNAYGETVAACDVSEDTIGRFKSAHPGLATYTDYRKLAEHPGLTAVIISTPNWLHREMAELFLNRGIHVFLEKPMGVNKAEIDSIVKTQRQSGKMCAIDFEMRISHATRRIKEIIDAGEIGTLRGLEFIHHRGGWLAQGNGVWRTDPARSGGLFFMEICHELDIYRYFLGEITHVQSFRQPNVLPQYPDNMPDNVITHVWFKGGGIGSLIASHTSSTFDAPIGRYDDLGHDMYMIFTGTEGCIRLECIRQKLLICRYAEHHPDAAKGKRVELNRIEDYSSVPAFEHDIEGNHLAFMKCAAEGRPFHQDTLDAWKTHVVCLAAEKSAVEKFQKIKIDYALPE